MMLIFTIAEFRKVVRNASEYGGFRPKSFDRNARTMRLVNTENLTENGRLLRILSFDLR